MTSTGITGPIQPSAATPGVSSAGGGMGSALPPAASPLPLWWWSGFPGEAPQVRQARSWIAKLLPACSPLDDLLIFTSELATNAVTHTRSGQPGGQFTVEVTWTPGKARVVVGDQGSDGVPATIAVPRDQENGRGLMLIDMMSAAWGMAGDANARWLWADVNWHSQGGPMPTPSVGSNSIDTQFAPIYGVSSGTAAWYSEHTGAWHATPPGTQGAALLSAPSPLALAAMLAARYPAAGITPALPRDTPPRKEPPMSQLLCTCGYQAEDPADLTAHFGDMFIPKDDIAPDGQAHYENSQLKHTSAGMPAPATLTCRCGVTTNFSDFDQHLLAIFAPADRIGSDGQKHSPVD
jgi:serine/threonine-protein kinase RsbW